MGAGNPLPTLKMLFFRGLNDRKGYSGVTENVSIVHKAELEDPERPAASISLVPLFSNQYLNAEIDQILPRSMNSDDSEDGGINLSFHTSKRNPKIILFENVSQLSR